MNAENVDLILVKLGGSIITNKDGENTANTEKLAQLAQEVSFARKRNPSLHLVIGHGAGSFGHPQAKRFNTIDGDLNEDSKFGIAVVREAVTRLNTLVISTMIKYDLPAVTLSPYSFITSRDKKVESIFFEPFSLMLQHRIIPVIHGDVVTDHSLGWTIFSGETILNILASHCLKMGFNPRLVIEVGKTQGVYNAEGQTIPEISESNFTEIQATLAGSEHADVTGGMLHKVHEARTLAESGVPTLLISSEKGNLGKAILGEQVEGTLIR